MSRPIVTPARFLGPVSLPPEVQDCRVVQQPEQSTVNIVGERAPLASLRRDVAPLRRIAVLTDAHANLPALEAALQTITSMSCDGIYHTGDLIGIGPFPAESLQLALRTPKLRMTLGNHEVMFAHGLPHPRPKWMSEGEEAHQQWVHAQLDPALRAVVAQWPLVIEEDICSLRIALLHYALAGSPGQFRSALRDPSRGDLDRLFSPYRADLVFYGHSHRASDVQGQARYVNPGSLGCFSEAVARFAVLDVRPDGTYELSQHAAPYDDASLLREFERRDVPDRDFIIAKLLWRTS